MALKDVFVIKEAIWNPDPLRRFLSDPMIQNIPIMLSPPFMPGDPEWRFYVKNIVPLAKSLGWTAPEDNVEWPDWDLGPIMGGEAGVPESIWEHPNNGSQGKVNLKDMEGYFLKVNRASGGAYVVAPARANDMFRYIGKPAMSMGFEDAKQRVLPEPWKKFNPNDPRNNN